MMHDAVDRVMAIMDRAFDPRWGEAWNRRQVGGALSMPHTHATLIDAAGRCPAPGTAPAAGFALVRAAPGEEEILLIAVLPELRGQGLGTALLSELARAARARRAEKLFLEMRENNPAIALYRAQGFETIGRRPNYYRRGEGGFLDALTFAKTL